VGVLMVTGRGVALLGMLLGLGVFAAGASHPLALFGLTLFIGLGNGLTLPSANAGTLSVRPSLAGTAAGLGGALVMALGAVLSTLTALVVEGSPAPFTLLTLLTGCVLLSLAAALVALRLERTATRGSGPRGAPGPMATGLPDASRDA
jgi:DHA1 family bicyclomycin/chloramphenicol resistance-like MFS transporter